MPYTWEAIYDDGRQLYQFEDGFERSTEQLGRAGLRAFLVRGHDGWVLHTERLQPGWCLIYRRRRRLGGGQDRVCHLVGHTRSNSQLITCLFEDGRSGSFTDWEPEHPWYYPIVPVPSDRLPVT